MTGANILYREREGTKALIYNCVDGMKHCMSTSMSHRIISHLHYLNVSLLFSRDTFVGRVKQVAKCRENGPKQTKFHPKWCWEVTLVPTNATNCSSLAARAAALADLLWLELGNHTCTEKRKGVSLPQECWR